LVYNYEHYRRWFVFGKNSVLLLPKTQAILDTLGEQIKMARLRRRISSDLVAARAGISRTTLWSVAKGFAGVTTGIYAKSLTFF